MGWRGEFRDGSQGLSQRLWPSNPSKPALPLTVPPSATWIRTSQSCSSSSRPSASRKPNSFSSLRRASSSQPCPPEHSPAYLGPAYSGSSLQLPAGFKSPTPQAPFSPVRGVQDFLRHQASDTVGPIRHKQRGPDIRRVRGVGRARGLGLLQHLRTEMGINPTTLGSHPGLRALRGWGVLTWSSCPTRGLESLSGPRTRSRIQGRRTTLLKPAIPAAELRGAPLARVSRALRLRLLSEEEAHNCWAGPEGESPPTCVLRVLTSAY